MDFFIVAAKEDELVNDKVYLQIQIDDRGNISQPKVILKDELIERFIDWLELNGLCRRK